MHPLAEAADRTIGLAWRQGTARAEEFQLLGRFIAAHRPRGSGGAQENERGTARRGGP